MILKGVKKNIFLPDSSPFLDTLHLKICYKKRERYLNLYGCIYSQGKRQT